jgi:hypothetical protein
VNFHVNFNLLLNKYIVHPLVKIKTLIISRCTAQLRKKKHFFCYVVECIFECVVLMCLLREG